MYDNEMTDRPVCEGKRLPAICDIAKKNGALTADISAGMDNLLELLTGPANSQRAEVSPMPTCLLDDIVHQGDVLSEVHAKLSRALAALNG